MSDTALLSALDKGVGLGEWLVAGPELMKKLGNGKGLNRVLADTIIAWHRTGLHQPLPEDDARRLWLDVLPPIQRQRLLARTPQDREALFQEASTWVCEPIIDRDLYEQDLVTMSNDGFVAHDYVLDQVVRDSQRPAVPDSVWHHALQIATISHEATHRPERMWEVGNAAYQERAFAHAMIAMQTLANTGYAGALYNVGVLFGELGQFEEAVRVYDLFVDRFGEDPYPDLALRQQVAQALVNKGVALSELGRFEEQVGVCNLVVDLFGEDPDPVLRQRVAEALVGKGVRLGELGRFEKEVGVYDQVVNLFGKDPDPALRQRVAQALVNKGVALGELGRFEEAVGVYDQVVNRFGDDLEPALRELTAMARRMKGEVEGER
jgi:tetratricopeptide (TPR) repeat protein